MEIMKDSAKAIEHDKKLLKAMSEVVDKVADELYYEFEPFDMGIRSKVVSTISELKYISHSLGHLMDDTDLVEEEVECFYCNGRGYNIETVQPSFNYDHWFEYEKCGMSPLQMLW